MPITHKANPLGDFSFEHDSSHIPCKWYHCCICIH